MRRPRDRRPRARGPHGTGTVHSSGIASPVTSRRGLTARLRYLDGNAGRAALQDQGVTPRTVRAWMRAKNTITPTQASREKIDAAYGHRRRDDLIRSGSLARHLDNDGRGSSMEIYPVDTTLTAPEHLRPGISRRTITVRCIWGDLVDARARKDAVTVDEIWDDVITDPGSDYNAYASVSSVGISA
ncbi:MULTISPECIES: hypothetical protein [unclassified Streptomyces]|uniref:hypothetical protein n=1 Tax=unclassified Streptomyces TaxID=2593676 RepID=UPI0036F68315